MSKHPILNSNSNARWSYMWFLERSNSHVLHAPRCTGFTTGKFPEAVKYQSAAWISYATSENIYYRVTNLFSTSTFRCFSVLNLPITCEKKTLTYWWLRLSHQCQSCARAATPCHLCTCGDTFSHDAKRKRMQ